MRVAIVHYHLGHGGVGAVIAQSSEALTRAGFRHVVLIGNPHSAGNHHPVASVREVPGLEYSGSNPSNTTADAGLLEEQLRRAAEDALGSAPDVWHFHNHSLGKNHLVAEVVARLAEAGERMILQIHDLAEDGRPENYSNITDPGRLYPFSHKICYVFLNSRDLEIFTKAGLPHDRARLLANPVNPPPALPAPAGDPLLLAPVRAIRRKNTGEMVLLSALLPEGARIAICRAPVDPAALAIHRKWSAFASDRHLPIGFDVVDRFSPATGASGDFDSWISHSTHILSTSVAEGFGLPLLEAAAWRRPLIGRAIPHLVEDHARNGIRAGWLYDGLFVPLDWAGSNILREHIRTTLERTHRMHHKQVPPGMEDAVFHALVRDGWLDFGNLPESLQQGVIERLRDPANRRVPLVKSDGKDEPAADWLIRALTDRDSTVTTGQLHRYSPETYQKNLIALLTNAAAEEPSEPVRFVHPQAVLSAFSAPRSFHFLCSAPPVPGNGKLPWRAVVFDIYGTLLIAPSGGVKPDPDADPLLRAIIARHGHTAPLSPSTALSEIIRSHHGRSAVPHPEIDMRVVWRELLELEPGTDITALLMEAELAWHPSTPMPGAAEFVRKLSRTGVSLGILSNAQCNSLPALGDIAGLFAPELCILSYQHGIAKPSPGLFQMLAERLAGRGIPPHETLYIGNDPLHDIVPARAQGFKTALFTGYPDSLREGACQPDITFTRWRDLYQQTD